jgi:hypothetical protein
MGFSNVPTHGTTVIYASARELLLLLLQQQQQQQQPPMILPIIEAMSCSFSSLRSVKKLSESTEGARSEIVILAIWKCSHK